ncbi:MAG: bis(5'-nucleosyl)-tetraphosphatase (symmetrical) YqeK [Butyricicoccus sp.]|nr:bis(5'-nucleosyl)-tetraphosphatase (symmetrical) YqeK [Butyricicoccus sp.]
MLCNELVRQSILSRLSGYRYQHTLGCEKAAVELARRFGADEEKAAFAAILHDITKRHSREEQLYLCEKYDIIPCDVERIEWKMLHGKTAAAIAKHEYGAPEDVCDAIACHTTGKAGMTMLDKVIYLADFIEETRDFDGVEPARRLAQHDIDRALLYCYDSSLSDLVSRGKLIHRDTIEARNDLILHGVNRLRVVEGSDK